MKSETKTKRPSGGLAGLGRAIMAHMANLKASATVSNKQANAMMTGRPFIHGFGAAPEVWGQSEACRRLVFKNRRAAQ